MKKTLTINLSGSVFHIDEDAYSRLNEYLSNLERRFAPGEEAREILSDVEARIGEIFRERLGQSRQVVCMPDVEHAISIMGMPEDFGSDQEPKEEKNAGYKSGKRIYRDPDNRLLGGVGGGLAAYFGIDVVVVRLILVLSFFVSGPLIYLVLWIVMPEAKTTAQRLEMKGESINVSNIEKNIKQEYEKVKQSVSSGKLAQETRYLLERMGTILSTVFYALLKLFMALAGVFLIVFSIVLLLGLTGAVAFGGWWITDIDLRSVADWFIAKDLHVLSLIGITLLIGIPLIYLLMGGIRLLVGTKRQFRAVKISLAVFWFMGFIICCFVVGSQMHELKVREESRQVVRHDSVNSKTIVLSPTVLCDKIHEETFDSDFWYFDFSEDRLTVYSQSHINIFHTDSAGLRVEVVKEARHKDKKSAYQTAQAITTPFSWNDSVISINPCFEMPSDQRFRAQKVTLNIYIPEGRKVYLMKGLEEAIDDAANTENLSHFDLGGRMYEMTRDGLKPL